LEKGSLTYGELVIPGKSEKEVLISTYVCHPSLGHNEISGIVVTMALANWLTGLLDREYTYRILFIPETIGAVTYLSKNSKEMKVKTIAGFVVTCVGDDRAYSFMPSRTGKTLADKIARFTLENYLDKYDEYSFLERGSDERQYCSPLIDLPVVSVMRSKYGTYPEYHTSLDNLELICPEGLGGAFNIISKCIEVLEINHTYMVILPCEPQLGKRGLYKLDSTKTGADTINNLLAYLDGKTDLIDISKIIRSDIFECNNTILELLSHSLVKKFEA
jgi:aminopeptidase-like protein